MSKSKKNTVDPEEMIKKYGADSVRWFILSDSPPEKDVQWSDSGVASSNKFLQKIWNLNCSVLNDSTKNPIDKNEEKELSLFINQHVFKINKLIENFQFNVAIAHFYEIYNYFNSVIKKNLSQEVKINNLEKIMRLLIPFIPHVARECLEKLQSKNVDKWPVVKKEDIDLVKINTIVIQVNGKTRDILKLSGDISEKDILDTATKKSKAAKFLERNTIIKHIYIKNKLINFVVK